MEERPTLFEPVRAWDGAVAQAIAASAGVLGCLISSLFESSLGWGLFWSLLLWGLKLLRDILLGGLFGSFFGSLFGSLFIILLKGLLVDGFLLRILHG